MRLKIILPIAAAAIIAGLVVIYFGYPPAAAAVCPACFGLSPAGSNVFVDDSNQENVAIAVKTIGNARERVRRFYGTLKSSPRILICTTENCYRRIGGGGSTGMALLDYALLLSPRGDKTVIASHEISHIEFHKRLGLTATIQRKVPQWFDEGLAALISDDPRYLKPDGSSDRCIVDTTQDLPTARSAWLIEARSQQLYAKAACRVFRWTSVNGGSRAVLMLLSELSNGATFQSVVH